MTPDELKQLSEKRVKLVKDARGILDKAKTEKRDLTAEENTQYEAIFKDVDGLREKIDAAVASETRAKRLEAEERWAKESGGRRSDPSDPSGGGADEVRELKWGENFRSPRRIVLAGRQASDEYRAGFGNWLCTGDMRALQADVPTTGGYLLAPTQMLGELIKFVDNALWMRQKARLFTVPAGTSLGAPSLDTDVDDADWTAELGTGNEDSALAFGKRELKPHAMAKRIKVSNTLLRASGQAESIVNDRLGYKHAVTAEKGYMTGSGAQQPLGVFTASALGISTGRDVSTGNTATSIQPDNLFEVKYSLKPQYQMVAEWVFHRDAVKQIRKLKDGEGRYIWQPGLTGTPDTLLDRPVNQSEYAPNTFTTGLYVGLFGDLSKYWIADSLDYQVQRLVELYAATNQTGFIGRMESDGMPVLEEAFGRVKLG